MTQNQKYRLGLDLGANSLGWVAVAIKEDSRTDALVPYGLLGSGVRMFDAGVEGSIEQGKDSSRGAKRREARQPRRQHWRRQQRLRKLFGILQSLELLPATEERCSENRHDCLNELDRSLTAKWCQEGDLESYQKLPYLLRSASLKQKLDPHELGRALYQLAQRRGYLSNRKTEKSDDEEAGKVQSGIDQLSKAISIGEGDEARQRTFAEFVCDEFRQSDGVFELSSEDASSPTRRRVRRHYTSRKMYVDEFHAIREAQTRLGCNLSEKDWKKIEKGIFFQRPMKSQKQLVGRCTLVKDRCGRGKRRCSIASLEFQEFRMLQGLNNLRIVLPDGEVFEWTPQSRLAVIDHLSRSGDLLIKPPRARKGKELPASLFSVLDLPKRTSVSAISFQDEIADDGGREDDVDTKLIGDRTSAKMFSIFGDGWFELESDTQKEVISSVAYITSAKSLKKLAVRKWKLSDVQATALCGVSLEDGYGALSSDAIKQLLPEMRKGASYSTARKMVFPESFLAADPLDSLPAVNDWNRDIKNPAVIRALSELRKVVNKIIERFGKPESIHIELARDLKRSRKDRKETFQKNEANRRAREKAVTDIVKSLGIQKPSRSLVDKWLLAEECAWTCPYTGKGIDCKSLDHFDIEHIYPRRYLDDSYTNKTLCDAAFNRMVKKDRLPSECASSEEFSDMLERVKRFRGNQAEAKLKRFQATEVPEGFVDRQLNDTRYNSRLASEFLGCLYGGRIDANGRQRIVTPTGSLTWIFRTGWGLNRILSETDQKDRRDNRHHAVDALCVALMTQSSIKTASQLAGTDHPSGEAFGRFVSKLADKFPWKSFLEDATNSIRAIIVSHRPTRTIAGPMHAETLYSKPHLRTDPKKGNIVSEFRIRKSLDKLTAKEIEGDQIVDPCVRAAVQEKFAELKAAAVAKKDQEPANMWADLSAIDRFPRLKPSAKKIGSEPEVAGSPILRVRLRTDVKPRVIGKGSRTRQIASGKDSNYAIMLYAVEDSSGKAIKCVGEIITRLEAHLRLSGAKQTSKDAEEIGNRVSFDGGSPRTQEKIKIPKTTEDLVGSDAPFVKLKQGETLKYIGTMNKNDMVELTTGSGERLIYRVQSFSSGEIQICEHYKSIVAANDRSQDNRITGFLKLISREIEFVSITPDGLVTRGV